MQTTETLGLKKPDGNEFYAVNVQNENSDALDALFEKDANGTVVAKNAKQLDGHGAEYFVDRGEVLNTSILEKALTVAEGVTHFRLGRGNYTGDDLPSTQYAYGMATVYRSSANGTTVALWCGRYKLPLAINQHNGTSWLGWDTVFTTDGGTINGNVVQSVGNDNLFREMQNTNRHLKLTLHKDGSYYLYDQTNGKIIYRFNLDGTNTFNGTASGNLPLTGGKAQSTELGGALTIRRSATGSSSALTYENADGVLGYLGVDYTNKPIFWGVDKVPKELLHTGNKPTGSYTGNGSAEQRTIKTGAIGGTNFIVRKRGSANFALVTMSGFIAKSDTNVVCGSSVATNADGSFNLANNTDLFNTSGATYDYYSI